VRVDRPIRYALEVRHDTFHDRAFLPLLRRWDVALCVADTAGKFPYLEEVTSDFVYVRLHGSKRIYASGYDASALDAWAEKIRAWKRRKKDVYVYFDNDVKVRAPFDAMNLAARLGQGELVTFPRKAHREAESRRGVEEPRPIGQDARWNFGRRRTA
jgi:uncharacterized protein YecE (DUF72 family)